MGASETMNKSVVQFSFRTSTGAPATAYASAS